MHSMLNVVADMVLEFIFVVRGEFVAWAFVDPILQVVLVVGTTFKVCWVLKNI